MQCSLWIMRYVSAPSACPSRSLSLFPFRISLQQKYFDSGDYNMAKAKMKNKQLPCAGPDKNLVTGDHIPTPQDLPQRKSSLVTSKLAGHVEDLHQV
ncbi:hypothetical protein XENTR_v10022337 [Xenopus tropicalis]|nr:hypothetical protein XENTR_v10022337 [Xenopus tropicalis]